MIDLSIVVPCFNEENNISSLVLRILNLLNRNIKGEIILINDGSSDRTSIEIERLSTRFNDVVGINHAKNWGITEAWNTGTENSHGRYVVTIDADLQYRPEDIEVLYRQIVEDDFDLVQGWRKDYRDKSLLRRFLSRALSHMLNILFFTKINDIKSGFVIYKRGVFSDILKERRKYRAFQHFFILCALKKGYRLKQVPVTFYPRLRGKSFIKSPLFFSLRVLLDIPRAILDFGVISRRRSSRRLECAV